MRVLAVAGRPGPQTKQRDAAPVPAAGLYARAMRVLVGGLFRLLFRVRVEGREHLPAGPCVFCANHLGWADPFLLLVFLPTVPRLRVLGLHPRAISAFRARVVDRLGILVELDRAHPVEAVRQARAVLAGGCSLIVFPEGTYQGGIEGQVQPLQPGAAYLAAAAGVPLVPIGLTGTKELWLRRPLTIRIGPPLDPPAPAGSPREQAAAVTAALRAALLALLPGDRAGRAAHIRPLRGWLSTLFD